jgi:hypothetical protein
MESTVSEIRPMVPDLKQLQIERDRHLAQLYVAKDESRTAVAEIVAETGVEQRTVYRAIRRQLEWARDQKKKCPAAETDGA